MKFFKIDEYKLYEKYFASMTVREFFELDHVPDNVEEEHMKNMTEFLKAEKDYFVQNHLGSKSLKNQSEDDENNYNGDNGIENLLSEDVENDNYHESDDVDELTDEEEFYNMTINEVVIRKMIEDGELDPEEIFGEMAEV